MLAGEAVCCGGGAGAHHRSVTVGRCARCCGAASHPTHEATAGCRHRLGSVGSRTGTSTAGGTARASSPACPCLG